MTSDQFIALLLFQLPFTLLFNHKTSVMLAIIVNMIVFTFLFIIAEKEFIKNCKKGYNEFGESIFPQFIYNHWKKECDVE